MAREGRTPLEVHVRNLQREVVDTELLAEVARAAVAAEGASIDVMGVVLVDDARISALNEQLLGRTGPTDVISFEAEQTPDGGTEAEAYISVERAAAQAREYRHALHYELAFLVAHAVLHALGWCDGHPDARSRMLARQTEIMEPLEARIAIADI
ncbi:MAG TPA: rRNA maturation RNase YbeY [Armatimonadetes bacterium]|nr:rRNA maturation RNase YbeY [Armatimonadota bacterium]